MTATIIYVLPGLLGLAIVTAILGVRRLRTGDPVADRLRRIRTADRGEADAALEVAGRPLPWWVRPVAWFSWLLPWQRNSSILRWELAAAGYRHQDAANVIVGMRALLGAGLGLGTMYGVGTYTRLVGSEVIVLTAVAALVGFVAPSALMRWKQKVRRDEITLALPDALDLMVICVEAGQGLNAALLSVSKESTIHAAALAEELRLVNLEMSTGVGRTQALRNFALRTNLDDVRSLVAVLVQSDKFGTSVAQALRVHAKSLRVRRRQRAEEAARKTPVKMLFPLVFCIFPALLVVILAPGMLQLVAALKGM